MSTIDLSIGAPTEPEIADDAVFDDIQAEIVPAEVHESMVRGLVRGIGSTLSYLIGDDDVDGQWRFTERELNDLVPPLTRIINRREKLRRAVMRGDEITIAIVIAGYAGRNIEDGRKAEKLRKERDGELSGEVVGGSQQGNAGGHAADRGNGSAGGSGGPFRNAHAGEFRQ